MAATAQASVPAAATAAAAATPSHDPDEHLEMGITLAGMAETLKRIGFPFILDGVYHDGTYKRVESTSGWITKAFGDGFVEVSGERKFVGTGYDLCQCIEDYQAKTGNPAFSMNEMAFKEKQGFVNSKATVFFSHQQQFSVGETLKSMKEGLLQALELWARDISRHSGDLIGTERYLTHYDAHNEQMRKLFGEREEQGDIQVVSHTCNYNTEDRSYYHIKYWQVVKVYDGWWWVDYFVLRQCQDDFEVERIYAVIGRIGFTMVEAAFSNCGHLLSRARQCATMV